MEVNGLTGMNVNKVIFFPTSFYSRIVGSPSLTNLHCFCGFITRVRIYIKSQKHFASGHLVTSEGRSVVVHATKRKWCVIHNTDKIQVFPL